jgi:hypothetical protein
MRIPGDLSPLATANLYPVPAKVKKGENRSANEPVCPEISLLLSEAEIAEPGGSFAG